MMEQQRNGQAIQKWLVIQAQKLHNAAYAEVGEKLGCEPEKEAIHAALRNLYDTEKRALEMIRVVDENQARREKVMKKKGQGMKKSRQRRMEAAEQQRQANLETTELEYQIQECEEELAEAKAAYEASDKKLAISKYDSKYLKEEALNLQERLKKMYLLCDDVETQAREAAAKMATEEANILNLSKKLVELKKKQQLMTALHFTLEEACSSETCKRVYWNTDAHKQEVHNTLLEIMTDVSTYNKDFQEMIGLANRTEICKIAEVLAYHKQLMAQYPGKVLTWHFSVKDTATELLEFAGLNVETSKG